MTEDKSLPIIQAWIDYTYYEDRVNAEVEFGRNSEQIIWTDHVSLVGDNLTLELPLFKQLKETSQYDPEFDLGFSFPQIYFSKGKARTFLPLFTVNITPIFGGSYRATGWDISGFEFQAIGENFMRLYKLDEDAADRLLTRESLTVFVRETFKLGSGSLQTLLNQMDLPNPDTYPAKRALYIFRSNLSFVNRSVRQDLKDVREQVNTGTKLGQVALDYLFGQPNPPEDETLYFGAFPGLAAPEQSQSQVLKHTQKNSITAVQGPPGVGKTFTALHLIAPQVVKRAVNLVVHQQDTNGLTLIASTNNTTLDQVRKILEPQNANLLYLPGGNREIIRDQTFPIIQSKIDWLRSTPFEPTVWQEAQQQLLILVDQLQQAEIDWKRQQQQNMEAQQQAQQLAALISEIEISLQESESNLQSRQNWLNQFRSYQNFPFQAYRRIDFNLREVSLSVGTSEHTGLRKGLAWLKPLLNLVQGIWRRIRGQTRSQLLRRLIQQSQPAILNTLTTDFPIQSPLDWGQLLQLQSSVTEHLKIAHEWQQQQNQYELQSGQFRQQQQNREVYRIQQQAISGNYQESPDDFYDDFCQRYHHEQQEIFLWSWMYLQQEALRRKAVIIPALELYTDVLDRNLDAHRRLQEQGEIFYKHLSLAFPIITSTLHSVRNMLPLMQPEIIRCSIIDEAGMTLPHHLFPVLVRSQQVIVIGDPMQLEPVMPLGNDDREKFNRQAFLERGLVSDDINRYSPASTQTATAYHRAAGANGQIGNLGYGIQLKEHFRSVEEIVGFFSILGNYDLNVRTPARNSPLGTHLVAYHVEGRLERNANVDEAAAIESILKHLIAQNYSLTDEQGNCRVGVISPFRHQANRLQQHLKSWLNSQNVNTVHKFQGGQREVIVFSPRQCQKNDSFWFINRTPNLLNVTVSRSQILFILVDNLNVLRAAGGYMAQLVDYIEARGEIRSLPKKV